MSDRSDTAGQVFEVLKKAMYESKIPMNGESITGITMFLVACCNKYQIKRDSLFNAIDCLFNDSKGKNE